MTSAGSPDGTTAGVGFVAAGAEPLEGVPELRCGLVERAGLFDLSLNSRKGLLVSASLPPIARMAAATVTGTSDASVFAGVAACEAICDSLGSVAWLILIWTFAVGTAGTTNCVPWVDSWDGLGSVAGIVVLLTGDAVAGVGRAVELTAGGVLWATDGGGAADGAAEVTAALGLCSAVYQSLFLTL